MKETSLGNGLRGWGFGRGLVWFLMSLVVSVANDGVSKHLGGGYDAMQVTFLRFFFSLMVLMPLVVLIGIKKMRLEKGRKRVHLMRGILLFLAIYFWCCGLVETKIAVATTMNFTIPIFILVMSRFFLKERVDWRRWLAGVVGFMGVWVILRVGHETFNYYSLWLVLSAGIFALLDVINKRIVSKEGEVSILFYTGLMATLVALVPAMFVWEWPSWGDVGLFFILGCGANVVLYCLLKAFKYTEISALAPFRYFEIVFSCLLGVLFFKEVPGVNLYWGCGIIVPSTLYLFYTELKQ